MAGTIDTTSKVSNQIMSSTSKTSNTKKSNTLNMENKPSCSRNAESGST